MHQRIGAADASTSPSSTSQEIFFVCFLLTNGVYELHDLSEPRLGHPLMLIRALSMLYPKIAYPWPAASEPLVVERCAILLLMGMIPYPGHPPYDGIARDYFNSVNFINLLKFLKLFLGRD